MKIRWRITLLEYKKLLGPMVHQPMRQDVLFAPFGIIFPLPSKPYLLTGFLLEQLQSQFADDDSLDYVDVALAAHDLGLSEAAQILDHGADWISHLLT